jgi:hypothetical protein
VGEFLEVRGRRLCLSRDWYQEYKEAEAHGGEKVSAGAHSRR